MVTILVTGSSDGLGRNAAADLLGRGHNVIVHARSEARAAAMADLVADGATLVVGDLSSMADVVKLADEVNSLGTMDAVIHNAGVLETGANREDSVDGLPITLAVNVVAPYILTGLMRRPKRVVFLSSGMHRSGEGSLGDLTWGTRRWNSSQAYSETKLQVTAFALTLAHLWPNAYSNAVDPGWVPTRMGGAGAPDNLSEGHETQCWLATSDDREALTSGGYWHHRSRRQPAVEAIDPAFQKRLMVKLAGITGVQID